MNGIVSSSRDSEPVIPSRDGQDNSSVERIDFKEMYEQQLEQTDIFYGELCRQDVEIERWQTEYNSLKYKMNKTLESFEKERKDWNRYKDDLFLVVRAANGYHDEAMALVKKHKLRVKQYETLNADLLEKINLLQEQLAKAKPAHPEPPRSSSCPHFSDDFREREDVPETEVIEEKILPVSEYDTANTMEVYPHTTTSCPHFTDDFRQRKDTPATEVIEEVSLAVSEYDTANTTEMDTTTSDENSFADCVDSLELLMRPSPPPVPSTTPLISTAKFENNKENFERGSIRVPKENGTETLSVISQNKSSTKRRSKGAAFFSSFQEDFQAVKETPQDADPFQNFMRLSGGSKRNALLRWCQNRTTDYNFVEITNFSTSWSDGMALNALLHSYLPDKIPYDTLRPENCVDNFKLAFQVAEAASIPHSLSIEDMLSGDRPSWEKVMNYVKDIYSTLENTVIQ